MKTYKVTITQNGKTYKVNFRTKKENPNLADCAQKCFEHFNLYSEAGQIYVEFRTLQDEYVEGIFFEEE